MPSPVRKKYLDAMLASLMLVFASGVSATAYRHIHVLDRFSRVELGAIPLGEHHFFVMDGERCVGTFETLNERQELRRLRGEAEIRATLKRLETPFRLQGEGFFNPLGQLVRSSFKLQFSETVFTLETNEVFPIKVNLTMKTGRSGVERQFQLPGPILLSGDESSGLILDYPGLRDVLPASLLMQGNAHRELAGGLRIIDAAKGELCSASVQASLDLDALTARSLPFLQPLINFAQTVPSL